MYDNRYKGGFYLKNQVVFFNNWGTNYPVLSCEYYRYKTI